MRHLGEAPLGRADHATRFLLIACLWLAALLAHFIVELRLAWEIVAVGVTVQWLYLWRGHADPLKPAILVGGLLLFLYAWVPLVSQAAGILAFADEFGREELGRAILIVAAAFNALVLGSFLGQSGSNDGDRSSRHAREAVVGSVAPAAVLVLGATLVSAVFVVQILGEGLSAYLHHYFEVRLTAQGWTYLLDVVAAPMVQVGTALVWYAWLLEGRSRRYLPTLMAVLLSAAIASFIISRMAFVVTALTLVLLYHYSWKRLALSRLGLLVATATILLASWGLYREWTLVGHTEFFFPELGEAVGFFLVGFDHLDTLIQTLRGLDLGLVELQYGRTWLNGLLPIPRSVLAWKPPTSSQYLGVHLFGLGAEPEAFWRAASLLPDLYVNFAAPGVLLGAGGLGWLAGRLYRWRPSGPLAAAVYCVLLPYFVRAIRDEVALAFRWAAVAALLLGALLLIGSWLVRYFSADPRSFNSVRAAP